MEMCRFILAGCFLALAASGCSGSTGPKFAKVTGKVTLDGQPVTGGNVYFFPEVEGQSSYGGIKPDGTYELYCVEQEGAVVGRHRVTVEGPQPVSEPGAVQPKNPVPEKYGRPETSEIVKEVADAESNTINIELTSS